MTLRIVCAWCGALMREGDEPVSHGICPACDAQQEAERLGLLSLDEVHQRLRELQLDVEALSAATGCCGVAESLADRAEEVTGLLGELVRRARAAEVVGERA